MIYKKRIKQKLKIGSPTVPGDCSSHSNHGLMHPKLTW